VWLSGTVIALAGVGLLVVGRLGALGRLPRNHFAGIRLPATMASDEAWRTAHRAAAAPLLAGGVAALVLGIATVASDLAGASGAAVTLLFVALAAVLGCVGLATVLALRAVR
jgi:uncharacterized membrane protein